MDNQENLDPKYLEGLRNMQGRNRARFWDGVWADQIENGVYRFNREINIVDDPIQYDPYLETWCSWDFGINDDTFLIWYQLIPVPVSADNPKGCIINVIDEYVNRDQDDKHYADVVMRKPYRNVRHCGDPSGENRTSDLTSWISNLRRLSNKQIDIEIPKRHSPTEYIDNANGFMPCVRLNEGQCPSVVEMLENWEYKKDADHKAIEGKPEHDRYSHPGTSFYYFFATRFPMNPRRFNTRVL